MYRAWSGKWSPAPGAQWSYIHVYEVPAAIIAHPAAAERIGEVSHQVRRDTYHLNVCRPAIHVEALAGHPSSPPAHEVISKGAAVGGDEAHLSPAEVILDGIQELNEARVDGVDLTCQAAPEELGHLLHDLLVIVALGVTVGKGHPLVGYRSEQG